MSFLTENQHIAIEPERILEHLQFVVIFQVRYEKIIAQTFTGHFREHIPEFPDTYIM